MEKEQNCVQRRVSALTALIVGFVVGLVAVWIYFLQRRTGRKTVATDRPRPARVELPVSIRESGPDDLTRVEGIGPKFASVLRSVGIVSFEQLAASSVDELRAIFRERGLYFANPTTWPEQAELAAVGSWDDLSDLQEELTAGRRS